MTEDNRPIITSRRTFLGQAIAVSAVALTSSRICAQPTRPKPAQAKPVAPTPTPASIAAPGTGGLMLPPLPYAHNTLEPYISAATISYHYGKHHRAYFENSIWCQRATQLQRGPRSVVTAKTSPCSGLANASADRNAADGSSTR
jgi:superoxide dismutase, Fe-Mn family